MAMWLDNTTADSPTGMAELIEQGSNGLKWRYVSPSLNGKLPSLSIKCKPSKYLDRPYNDDTLSALMTADPAASVFANIAVCSADGVTNPPNSLYLALTLSYYVTMYDRITAQPLN